MRLARSIDPPMAYCRNAIPATCDVMARLLRGGAPVSIQLLPQRTHQEVVGLKTRCGCIVGRRSVGSVWSTIWREATATGWLLLLIAILAVPTLATAQDAYTDPAGSGVILGAVKWVQGTLLGTVATVVAVIAVASVGFMMLTGRMNWRHGAVVILGCFILFGATSIVGGIRAAASLGG